MKVSAFTNGAPAQMSDILGAVRGNGNVRLTVADMLAAAGGVFNVKAYGAVGNGIANDTAAINAAIGAAGAAGGGIVYVPAGTYLVSNSNPSAINLNAKRCIYLQYDNVKLVGAGRGATIIKQAASFEDDAHVIAIGSRSDTTVIVTGCGVSDLEVDGNRLNQTAEDEETIRHDGINVSTGCTYISLQRLYVHDTTYYGIGLQSDDFHNCLVEDARLENTGADCLDWKDTSDANTGNVIRRCTAANYSLKDQEFLLSSQAGFDLRSGIHAEDLIVTMPDVEEVVGIRLQNGVGGTTPVQATKVNNFRVFGSGAVNSVGVRVGTRYAGLRDGRVTGCADGYSLSDPDCRFSDLIAEDNDTGFRFWQNSGAGTEADIACLVGLIARDNSQNGFVYDSVDELTVLGADARNNAIGHDIRSGCTNIRILGGSATGNSSSNITDNGTSSIIENVSGFRTKSIRSGTAAIDSTGIKTITIAHGLNVTPGINEVSLTLRRNTNVTDWTYGLLMVDGVDATNITVKLNVTTASATAGALITVVATTHSKTPA